MLDRMFRETEDLIIAEVNRTHPPDDIDLVTEFSTEKRP